MQPLRVQHRIERTHAGDIAWRETALEPEVRRLLGAVRSSKSVGDLLVSGEWSPGEVERIINNMARSGWVTIREPQRIAIDQSTPPASAEDAAGASALDVLLQRHREERLDHEETADIDGEVIQEDEAVSDGVARRRVDSSGAHVQMKQTTRATVRHPKATTQDDRHEPLPFDPNAAIKDGLFDALRNPASAIAVYDNAPQWAPKSGGLAALLLALGEPVPDGLSISPDQKEHLSDISTIEPWGGAFAPLRPNEEDSVPFVRLKDHAAAHDGQPHQGANLGALRVSLDKVHKEREDANLVRDRARVLRKNREAELHRVHEEQAARRHAENIRQESSTLVGLSQRLARAKSDRDQKN